jgi:Uma2 family endonuclease
MRVITTPALATDTLQEANGHPRMTLEEFLALPEGPPYYEFEAGVLIPMPRLHARHQRILLALAAFLWPSVETQKLGQIWPEVEVILPRRTHVYVPDLVFLTTEHLVRLREDGRIHGAPDLVVEILSPSPHKRDRLTKLNAYRQAGVPWYWLIEPDDLTIEELELTERGYLVAQTVAPGQLFTPTLFPALTIDLNSVLFENDGFARAETVVFKQPQV